jgi:coenzyme F420-dependent glucose-6-phosphate dehydrogenase
VAASGPTVAKVAGRVADGFLTVPASEEKYTNVLFPALEEGIKEANRSTDQISKSIVISMTYDTGDPAKALHAARPWAGSILPVFYKTGFCDPQEIEENGNLVGNEQLSKAFIIGTSAEPFIKGIEKYAKLGFDQIHVASSSPSQEKFIDLFKREVIPYFKSTVNEK